MACASPSTYAPSRNAHADMKWLSRNLVETAVYFNGSGKKRKMGLGHSLARFDGVGRLQSRRYQKAGKQQHIPNDILSKRQDSPCENRAKRARDGNRTKIREPHAPKDMQDESRKPISATFCRPPRNAVRPEPAPRVSLAKEMACKRTNGLCTRTDSIQGGKSPPKPCFSLLPALAGTALRQKSSVFAEGDSFLCGKRFCFYREKTPSGTEKCFIQTVSPPVF